MREYFVWLAKLITTLVLIFIVVPTLFVVVITAVGAAGSTIETMENEGGQGTVAVIELKGEIDDVSETLKELYKQADDNKVDGIVLRIDSPGGAVGPSQEIYQAVKRLKAKKPIVASMGTVAASGGLYAALGASKVLAQPGTMTGSIGVIAQFPNFNKISQTVGVSVITVKSGQLKDVGNPFRDMTDPERMFLEATIKAAHSDFISAVAEGRGIPRAKVESFADGRFMLGSQAKEFGLIDGYGDIYDAARLVFDLKGSPLPAGTYPKLKYVKDNIPEFLRDFVESGASMANLFSRSLRVMYL